MYSYSSQLFKGVTQYILNESTNSQVGSNQQKEEDPSGRFIADMMFQSNAQSEMRYLHDFAFNLFETELDRRKLLYDVTKGTTIKDLQDKSFVRVRGKVIFEDFNRLRNIIADFNEIGRAFGELQGLGDSLQNEKSRKMSHQLLVEKGLNLDDRFIKNISKIYDFGYQDNYDIRFAVEDSELLFTAIINQEYLKESERSLINKYSRKSEKEFTVIGSVSQSGMVKASLPTTDGGSMRSTSLDIIDKLSDLEDVFCGRADNECIIDPIAIFTEI